MTTSATTKTDPVGHGASAASYWAVVWQQLRKNTVAMAALRTLVALWALAIAAPLLASNVPLIWSGEGGALPRLPVVERLFDHSLYPSGVDQFFNLLLVALPIWLLAPRLRRGGGPRRALVLLGLVAWSLVVGLALIGSRASLFAAVAVALLGGAARFVAAGGRRRFRAGARWTLAFLLVCGLLTIVRGIRDEWPVRDWVKDAGSSSVAAVFPLVPFHPDNVGDSEALARGDPEGSRRASLSGYDLNGRDVASRLLFGTRISLTIGVVAVSIFVAIGVVLGSLAGYYGGKVDLLISRFIEVMICFPTFFLLLTIIAVFESRNIFLIMLAIGAIGWTGVARLVRGEFIRQRNLDYVTAARSLGLPQHRIIFRHVLPNCLGPVLVSASFGVASSILLESGLAFLGLGDVSAPSWGQMLTTGRSSQQWHLILSPGFAIFFVVLVFNLLGEGLRDALDPKLRR
jgi:peptide/nickel transport system permease protein